MTMTIPMLLCFQNGGGDGEVTFFKIPTNVRAPCLAAWAETGRSAGPPGGCGPVPRPLAGPGPGRPSGIGSLCDGQAVRTNHSLTLDKTLETPSPFSIPLPLYFSCILVVHLLLYSVYTYLLQDYCRIIFIQMSILRSLQQNDFLPDY